MNIAASVNAHGLQTELELTGKLKELLGGIDWLKSWEVEPYQDSPDARWDIVVDSPDGPVFFIECKSELSPKEFLQTLAKRPLDSSISSAVLGMPRITPRMAQVCQENGWGWYDLAGNCHLEIPGRFFLERTGLEPVKRAKQQLEANLSTSESGSIVRALLAPENAGRRWTQREVVEHFHNLSIPVPAPSLALVNKVVQYLRDQAVIESVPSSGFLVSNHEGLLQMWTKVYRFDRCVQRRYFTLLKEAELNQRLRSLEGQLTYALAAFSAANVQAPHVRQPRTWLYGNPSQESSLARYLEAKLVDTGQNLVLLLSEDRGVFYGPEQNPSVPTCTNPVQTYVDLLRVGGRGQEAADALLTQRLLPRWREGSNE